MHHASITVAPDRSAQVTIAGQSTEHPDLGSAMTQLTLWARETSADVAVAISDGTTLRSLTIASTGQVLAGPPGSSSPTASPDDRSAQSAESAQPAKPQTEPAAQPRSHPHILEEPEADVPTQPLAAPQSPPDTAPADAGAPAPDSQADPAHPPDDEGPAYPIGTPFSGPAAPPPTSTPRRIDRVPSGDSARAPSPAEADRTPARSTNGTASGPTSSERGSDPHRAMTRRAAAHRSASARRKRSSARLTVPSIVLIALLVLAAVLFFLPNFIGTPTPEDSAPAQNSQAPTRAPLTQAEATTPVPGFTSDAAWETTVPQNASVTATSRGVLVVDGDEVTIIDPSDGSERFQESYDGAVTFAADTTVDGQPALVWQHDSTVQALLDGESRPIEYELTPEARLSSAGTAVLIRDGNALSTLGEDGLVTVPTPAPGSTPMALDGEELISSPFNGPLSRTDIDTGEETEVEPEQPGEGLEIKEWKSAGHGLAISVWGDPGASTNSGHRLQLVVHSLDDGAVASINEVSSADIGDAAWTRGQGYSLASIGPYLYDLDTGLLVLDGTDSGMQFGEPRGDLVPGTMEGQPVIAAGLLSDAPTAYSTNADLLAVTDDARFAITRTGADRITAYPAG